jgi:hypothetical protein
MSDCKYKSNCPGIRALELLNGMADPRDVDLLSEKAQRDIYIGRNGPIALNENYGCSEGGFNFCPIKEKLDKI